MRALKILGWTVLGLVALGLVAAGLLIAFIDPNDYKGDVERVVEQQTHRKLTLQGDLKLKVFPWLAVELGPAQLSERVEPTATHAFGDQPFVSLQSARLSVKLLPLLRRQVQIGRVELIGPHIRLITAADGRHNWDDLTASKADAPAENNASSGNVNATIAGIEIREGEVVLDNRQEKSLTALHDFYFAADGIGQSQPSALKTSFALEQNGKTSAKLILTSNVNADWDNKVYALDNLVTELTYFGADMPKEGLPIKLGAKSAHVNLAQQSADLANFELAVGAAQLTGALTGTEILDAPKLQGHLTLAPVALTDWLKQLGIKPPVTRDQNVLKRMSLQSDVAITNQSLTLEKIQLKLDDTTASGRLAVADFKSKALRFDLDIDRMDVDRYLPPSEPVSSPAAATAQSAPTPIPVEMLRTLNARGDVRIGQFKFSGIQFSQMRVGLNARDGDVQVMPAHAALYGGTYDGDVTLNVAGKTPRLALTATAKNIDFVPFLKDMLDMKRVSGRGNFQTKLTATGADTQAMMKTLSGPIEFNIKDGAYEGMDLWYEIRRARAVFRQQPIPAREGAERTAFNSIQGTGTVTNGVCTNNDLLVSMQYLKVDGKGQIDLVNGTMDYRLNAKVLRIPAEGADAAQLGELVDAEIPIKVSGPMASPKVRPDVEGLAKAKAKEVINKEKDKLQQKLQDKLKDLLSR